MIDTRFFWLLTLLVSMLIVSAVHAEHIDPRCSDEDHIYYRPLTQCEWSRVSPGAGDPDACIPVNLTGTHGNDRLIGNDGDDVLIGKRGDDTIIGYGGDDMLRGGDGNDTLSGGPGEDELRGWIGDDTYNGGPEADRFSFNPWEHGDKIIEDFDPCKDDKIILVAGGSWPFTWPKTRVILATESIQDGFYVYILRQALSSENDLTIETDIQLMPIDFVRE